MILHSESDLPVHEEVLDASGDPLCVYGDVSALGNEIFIESSPGPSKYVVFVLFEIAGMNHENSEGGRMKESNDKHKTLALLFIALAITIFLVSPGTNKMKTILKLVA